MSAAEALHIIVDTWRSGCVRCEGLTDSEVREYAEAMAVLMREDVGQ